MKTVVLHSQQRWEYISVDRKTEGTLMQELNSLGQQGWELVSVINFKDMKGIMSWAAFFKRPSGAGAVPATENSAASNVLGAASENSRSGIQSTLGSGLSTAGTGTPPKAVKVEEEPELDEIDELRRPLDPEPEPEAE